MRSASMLASIVLLLHACGGGERESAGASGTETGIAGSASSGTTGTSGAPTTSETGGGVTGSATEGGAASTGAGTGTGGSTGTGDATGGTTGGSLPFCGEDPPKGYVGPFDMNCATEPQAGTFTPVAEWEKQVWATDPAFKQVIMQPVVGPLTDDDQDGVYGSVGDMPTVLAVTYGPGADQASIVRAVAGDGSKELFSIKGQSIAGLSGLAIADIDDDPAPEIIAVTVGLAVKAFEHDGALKWTSPAYAASDCGTHPYAAAPAVGDMDADGKPEIVVGRAIYNSDGTLRGKGMFGSGKAIYGCTSFPADIDGDGVQEVIVGNAIYDPNGAAKWSVNQPDGYPAVADFDADGVAEIVVAASGEVRMQTAAGGVLWDVANPAGVGGPPTIADYDGDGAPEIGVAGKTGYVVFEGDGSILWTAPTKDASSATTGSAVYDFEGDGVADVVYADELNLWVFSGNDGAVKLKYTHSNGTIIEYPIVADVDNDGEVEIVVGRNNNYFGTKSGLLVLGDMNHSWRPGRRIWNQHAYSITNVGDDGSIPSKPALNWLTHNNFRSGDLSANDGLAAPDLKLLSPDSCINECSGPDKVKIWYQLGNAGAAPLLAGATVEVHGTKGGVEMLITAIDVPGPLAPGEFADAASVEVDSADLEQIRLVAIAKEAECVIDPANEIVLKPPFCTAPG